MENTITNKQVFMVIVMVVVAYSSVDVSKIMMQYAGEGGWLTILINASIFALLAFSITALNNMFPGKTVFEYGGLLIGRMGTYLIAIFIAVYFIAVAVADNIALGNMLQTNFLPDTPTWATVLAALPVLGFVAYKGITNTARLIEIYGVILLVIALATYFIMLLQGDYNHILPLFVPAETGRYITATKDTLYPFLGFEVLLIIPFTEKNNQHAGRSAIFAMIFVGFFYILSFFSCVLMIGENEVLHYNFPLIAAIRQVTLPQLKLFARIDLLYLTVGFLGIVGGLSFVYLGAVELFCRMIPPMKRLVAVLAVGAAIFICVMGLRELNSVFDILKNLVSVMGVVTGGAIPLTLLLIAKVKNHAQKKPV